MTLLRRIKRFRLWPRRFTLPEDQAELIANIKFPCC
jgi:hypothetical protein